MNYIFQVRDWNIDFYIHLEIIIKERDKNADISWFTMVKSAYNKLNNIDKKVYYLPHLFETNSNEKGKSNIELLDNFMFEKYNFGVEYLYEIERFKPLVNEKTKFINGHVETLLKIIPEKAKMIALSCDHFVYFISAYINEFKGGTNYFIQPIGFPQNAQVIMHNPWDLNYFRNKPLNEDSLNKYVESLKLDPKVSIHYMKPQKLISLKHSILKRLKDITQNNTSKNVFTYLEPQRNNLIPGRFLQKTKINYSFNYFTESDIAQATQICSLFYYPLQFEPEMSILAYSPWYKSQLEVIRLISQSLKTGDILLLKENPKMIGKRSREYYSTIEAFGNVIWAHPDISSRQIIRQSYKVISITGTATIEAACLGVNSLMFGHPPFRNLLLEKPVADQPLSNFISVLYRQHNSNDIIQHIKEEWDEFSKSLFFGNFIPSYLNNKFTIENSDLLAKQFAQEVLFI